MSIDIDISPRADVEDWHDEDEPPSPVYLAIRTISELKQAVAAAGPRQWLVRGVITSGTYGVHAAPPKAQKTFNASDLAVSVASGTPWLDHFPIDQPGPVLMFAGEGGDGPILRRIDAVARARGIDPDTLQLAIGTRSPHLNNAGHMAEVREALARYRPVLVILDPFYLSARGAKLTDLYEMGALLETIQHICAEAGAALLVVHHYNRNREGRGSDRFSGAGPAEWGRFLIGSTVVSRYTDQDTQQTSVTTELELIGGEVADQTYRVHRTIRATDPDDLDSPLEYAVNVTSADQEAPAIAAMPHAKPAVQRVHGILLAAGVALTVKEIGDRLADDGHPLKARTIQDALKNLGPQVDGLIVDSRGTTQWTLTDPKAGTP